jgi:hypothetical protein
MIAIFSKVSSNKVTIHILFLGMSMLFYCTKLPLSKCKGSWIVYRKQNMNLKHRRPSTFLLLILHKSSLVETIHILQNFHHIKCYGPIFTAARLLFHLRNLKGTNFENFDGMRLESMASMLSSVHDLPNKFHENLLSGSKVTRARHTERKDWIPQAFVTFLRKVGKRSYLSSTS